MRKRVALVIGCLVLVAAGCGDDEDEQASGGGEETATQEKTATREAAGSGGAAAKTASVSLKGIKFQPAAVTVAKGGTVTWTNDEAVPHDVTKRGGPGPDFSSGTGNLQQADTYKRSFTQAGTVEYVCTVHPGMKGTVAVK